MTRPTFGDHLRYRLASAAELSRGGPIVALCAPAPHDPLPVLRATEERGIPCHRCIANTAPAGAPAACSFLAGRLTVARPPSAAPLAGGLFAQHEETLL